MIRPTDNASDAQVATATTTATKQTALRPLVREQIANTPSKRSAVLQQISNAQICGLGGGRFDTAVKLRCGFGARAVIVNGLQSEPNNNSDIALLQENPVTVVAGAAIAAFATGTGNITLALPNDIRLKKEIATRIDAAIDSEAAWLNKLLGIEIHFDCRYVEAGHASGEEHQLAATLGLLEAVTDGSAHNTAPLVESGIVCINLATAYAIARAVFVGEKLTRRMISIAGAAEWVDIGTPLTSLIPANTSIDDMWVNGRHGGNPINTGGVDRAAKVHAGMFSIDSAPPPPTAPCINCSACVPACPVDLRPDELYQQLDRGETPDAHLNLIACIECGACNAVCPSGLWLAQTFRQARAQQKVSASKNQLAQKAKARSDARAARLATLEEQRAKRAQQRSSKGKRAW